MPKDAPKKAKRSRRKLKLLLLLILLVGIAPLVAIGVTGVMAEPAQADVIVVPGAALRKGGRELSGTLQSRMDRAIELWQGGYAPKLLLSGGGEGRDNEAEAMARYAIAKGVPAQAILLEKEARTTRQNADNVAKIMDKLKLERALVVSNWYHVSRMRLALEQADINTSGAASESPGNLENETDSLGREWLGLWGYAMKADRLRG